MNSGMKRNREEADADANADTDADTEADVDPDVEEPKKKMKSRHEDWDLTFEAFLQLKESIELDTTHILLERYYEDIMVYEMFMCISSSTSAATERRKEFTDDACSKIVLHCVQNLHQESQYPFINHVKVQQSDQIYTKDESFLNIKKFIWFEMNNILKYCLQELVMMELEMTSLIIQKLIHQIKIAMISFNDMLKDSIRRNRLYDNVIDFIQTSNLSFVIGENRKQTQVEWYLPTLRNSNALFHLKSIDEWIKQNIAMTTTKQKDKKVYPYRIIKVSEKQKKDVVTGDVMTKDELKAISVSTADVYKDFLKWFRFDFYPKHLTRCPTKEEFCEDFRYATETCLSFGQEGSLFIGCIVNYS